MTEETHGKGKIEQDNETLNRELNPQDESSSIAAAAASSAINEPNKKTETSSSINSEEEIPWYDQMVSPSFQIANTESDEMLPGGEAGRYTEESRVIFAAASSATNEAHKKPEASSSRNREEEGNISANAPSILDEKSFNDSFPDMLEAFVTGANPVPQFSGAIRRTTDLHKNRPRTPLGVRLESTSETGKRTWTVGEDSQRPPKRQSIQHQPLVPSSKPPMLPQPSMDWHRPLHQPLVRPSQPPMLPQPSMDYINQQQHYGMFHQAPPNAPGHGINQQMQNMQPQRQQQNYGPGVFPQAHSNAPWHGMNQQRQNRQPQTQQQIYGAGVFPQAHSNAPWHGMNQQRPNMHPQTQQQYYGAGVFPQAPPNAPRHGMNQQTQNIQPQTQQPTQSGRFYGGPSSRQGRNQQQPPR